MPIKNSLFKSLKVDDNIIINQIKKISITELIEELCVKNLDKNYFISSSLIYCFSLLFPFINFKNNEYFLSEILCTIKKMNCFQRYYIYIVIKSIDKYYSINNIINKFSDLNIDNIFIYYNIIINFIKDEFIPNQEIIEFFREFSEQNKNQFNIVNNYLLHNNIKIDNIIISKEKKILNIKQSGKEIKAIAFEPFEIYKQIKTIYREYDFNIINLEKEAVIEIIINIINFIINDECFNNNIIQFLLDLIMIIVDKFKIDINKYNEKIIEKSIYKMNKLNKYLSF